MLAEKFLKLRKNRIFWPPINNSSVFVQGSGWNTHYFLNKFYKDRNSWPALLISKDKKGIWYMFETKMIAASEEFFSRYLNNPKILKEIIDKYNDYALKIRRAYIKMDYNYINSISYSQLLKEITLVRNNAWFLNSIGWFSLIFDKDLCIRIIAKEKFPFSTSALDKIWDRGVEPSTISFNKEQKMHFLNLICQGEKPRMLAEKCQFFYASYFDTKDLKTVEKKLKKDFFEFFRPQNACKEIKRENKIQKKIKDNYQKWFKGLSKKEKILVNYFQKIIWLKDNRKNHLFMSLTLLWRTAQRMFREAGLSEEYIPYYSYQEMKKGIAYLKANKNKIKQRKNGVACLAYYNGHTEIKKEDFDRNLKILESARATNFYNTDENIVKGQIGSHGRTKGIARIVLDINQTKIFKKGNILVTGMTRPEFVPLMKKASAIITDEGSITCHAAIVSRELKIPCIIGTKIATQVLKDGDLLEVDANKGIVKIIKK